jgi:hypothetical protein
MVHNNFHTVIPLLRDEGHNIAVIDGTREINTIGSEIAAVARKIIGNGKAGRRSGAGSESRQIASLLEASAVAHQ